MNTTFEVVGVQQLKHSYVLLTLKEVDGKTKINMIHQLPDDCDPKTLMGQKLDNCRLETVEASAVVLTRLNGDHYIRGWEPNTIAVQTLNDFVL